jgi:NAD-dependent deacetylase
MPDLPSPLIDRLRGATHVVALTGAGISAESGIPTFRDPGGVWEKFDPQELANVEAFLDNPTLVQEWYQHRRHLVDEAAPNAAHEALAELEAHVPTVTVITQNVDDLHNRAGSQTVLELHGNITRNYCMDCEREVDAAYVDDSIEDGQPATCPDCGGLVRPDVVWFGEMLPPDVLQQASRATDAADVFLSIGTSAVVHPAASLPLQARDAGAYVAEINPESTPVTQIADAVLQGPAGTHVPALLNALQDA